MSIKFVDAPPPGRTGKAGKHSGVANELRENPEKWALIAEGVAQGMSSHINSGTYAAYRPKGVFEAVSRTNGNGKFDVYARYIGKD